MRMLTWALKAAVVIGAVVTIPLANAQSIAKQLAVYEVADCDAMTTNSIPVNSRQDGARSARLGSRSGVANPTQLQLWKMICEANNWAIQGRGRSGDLNGYQGNTETVAATLTLFNTETFQDEVHVPAGAGEPLIDWKDALIMYQAYENTGTVLAASTVTIPGVGTVPTSQEVLDEAMKQRDLRLFPYRSANVPTGTDEENDAYYKEMLKKAWELKCTTDPGINLQTQVPDAVKDNFPGSACG